MKIRCVLFIVAAIACYAVDPLAAQPFSSGSDGSLGPLNITNNTTLDMPKDGIFHCTTITIESGATLRFNKNPLNTPVYLLATGDVVIAGTVDISGGANVGRIPGKGGPGGFDGGHGSFAGFSPGDGHGPGAGKRVPGSPRLYNAAFAFPAEDNTNTYGNTLLTPLIGGSGGGGDIDHGGGGGGGAILIASSTRVAVSGEIVANGGFGWTHGSGGSIRVVAPVVSGAGALRVEGNSASDGRTRIDSLDRFAHASLRMEGKATRGMQMFVFRSGQTPRLNIVEAAGVSIPVETNALVTINLPAGSPPNQTVRVEARNFTSDVPIAVVVTPESGGSSRFDGVIPFVGNPATSTVNITLPLDTVCHLHVWTR